MPTAAERPTSIVELQGLGKEIWQGMDAQEFVGPRTRLMEHKRPPLCALRLPGLFWLHEYGAVDADSLFRHPEFLRTTRVIPDIHHVTGR